MVPLSPPSSQGRACPGRARGHPTPGPGTGLGAAWGVPRQHPLGCRPRREPSPPYNLGPGRAALARQSWQPSLGKQPEGTSSSLFSATCQEPCGDAALPGTSPAEAWLCHGPAGLSPPAVAPTQWKA